MTTAVAKKPLRQVDDVKQLLHNDQAREQLAAVAAKHMNPQRLMRVTANAIRTTPMLQECEPLSFLGALMQCASLGLEPNTVLGHAYLIPFKNRRKNVTEVQVVVGYKGLIDLARRSGHITSISANIHYSDDDLWDYEEGTDARLRHRPGAQDGEKLHAYAIAKFTDGGHAYVVLPWSQVMKVRDGSQGYQTAKRYGKTDGSPWTTHEDAMAKKTAIRALAKYLPLSVEFSDAVQADHDGGAHIDYGAYALNPDAGPTVDEDHDGETIEGTAGEPESEEDTGAKEDAKPAAKKDAAPAKPKPREKVDYNPEAEKPEQKDDARAQNEKEEVAAPAVDPKHHRAREQIENDLADGAPASGIRTFYADQLDAMKSEAPELHAEVEKALAEAEAEG